MDLRERIKRLCGVGFTIKCLGIIANIKPNVLYNYTSNKSNLSKENIEKLEKAIDFLEKEFLKEW